MNRRDFLDPRRLVRQTAQALDAVSLLPQDLNEPSADPLLLHFSRRAMATTFEVILPHGASAATAAAQAALDFVDRLEDQLTIYRPHSEVSQLNARAGQEAVVIESTLFELLRLAGQIHHETQGAFDIATGALIKAWGFHARAGRVPAPDELNEARDRSGWRQVSLDPTASSVSFQRPGVEINLGSIGKGYALDRVVQLLWKDWHLTTALVHGGHSSIVALGSEPGRDDGWPILLSDPRDPEQTLGLFRLKDRALATSSATYQHVEHEGKRLGHILDPRTGWPADGMLSATVTAPTGSVADALATAFFILGPELAAAYCQAHPEVGAVLIANLPSPQMIVLGRANDEFGSSGHLPLGDPTSR